MKLNKSQDKISVMFDEIAPKYDFLNHLFTLNIDKLWRKEIINNLENFNFKKLTVLDLAAGTGDLTKELLRLNPDSVYACDISEKMLDVLTKKITSKNVRIVNAEAENLPFVNNSFNLVTIGFGIRNFYELEKALNEIYRVMDKNGILVIIDFFKVNSVKAKIFNLYMGKVIPAFGNLISKSKTKAYSYLNESISDFLTVDEFITLAKKSGFNLLKAQNNFLDVVNTIYLKK